MNARAHATAQVVKNHRRLGLARRRARPPRQVPPRTIEREYGQVLVHVVDETKRILGPILEEIPRLLVQSAAERRHDATDPIRRFNALMEEARRQVDAGLSRGRVEAVAERFGRRIADYHAAQLERQLRAGVGVNLFSGDRKTRQLLAGFAHDNAVHITSIPERMLTDFEKTVSGAFAKGKSSADIAELIEDRFGVEERKAQLLARDQTLTLYGQFNETRQTELGIKQFIWRTVGDEAVRVEHEILDGETFDWDDPPNGEIPGEAINCRCWAEPVLSDILDAANEEEE